MHKQRVQHRDLKLENIMMALGVPKIGDFELALYVKLEFIKRKNVCGSPVYYSPEMITNKGYNKKADVWCLGIIFYEITCGYFPFELKDFDDLQKITKGHRRTMPSSLNPSACQLLEAMLNIDSSRRLDIGQVLSHPFFQILEDSGEVEECLEKTWR